jgi:predicted transposase YbfD/YdcC
LGLQATVGADHGRIEVRHHYLSTNIDWLKGTKHAPNEPNFPHLRAIGMVKNEIERNGEMVYSYRYYLTSLDMKIEDFANAVRSHWGVENRLHWVMDVVFHDDLSRLRTGDGAKNMVTIKHMARNMIEKTKKGKDSLTVKRKKAGWNLKFLTKAIKGEA